MLKYRPFEMHCHTRHSDGTFLVPQLIESVAAYGYAGLALTDHNAVTGLLEVTEELQRKNNCLEVFLAAAARILACIKQTESRNTAE